MLGDVSEPRGAWKTGPNPAHLISCMARLGSGDTAEDKVLLLLSWVIRSPSLGCPVSAVPGTQKIVTGQITETRPCCVTLGKLLSLSVPQFPHLSNEDHNNTQLNR